MGKFSNRFLNIMKLNEGNELEGMLEDEIGEEEEEQEEEEEEGEKEKRFSFFRGRRQQEEEEEEEPEPIPERTQQVVTPIQEVRRPRPVKKQSGGAAFRRGEEVKVVKPQSIIESKMITDYLKANKTVIVNLEGIEVTVAQRIIDCIGGASYALDAPLEPISNRIFIVAPKDTEISGDLRDEAAGESFISPDLGNF